MQGFECAAFTECECGEKRRLQRVVCEVRNPLWQTSHFSEAPQSLVALKQGECRGKRGFPETGSKYQRNQLSIGKSIHAFSAQSHQGMLFARFRQPMT